MTREILLLSLTLLVVASTNSGAEPFAQQSSTCAAAYQGALSNIDSGQRVRIENAIAYQKYCKATGEFDKSNYGLQASAIVESIPLTVGLQAGSDDEKMEQFCKTGFSQNGFYSSDLWYAKTAAEGAQRNFNECRALESRGLIITHSYAAPRFVVVMGRYIDRNTMASLDRVSFDSKRVRCSSTSFGDGNPMHFSSDTKRLTADNDFTIQCERVPVKYQGMDYYPDAQIVISISKAGTTTPYVIQAPAEDNLGPTLSSDAQKQMEEINKKNNQLLTQLAEANRQRDIYITRLNNANVTSIVPFSTGERDTGFPGTRFDPRDNPNLDAYVASQCGAGQSLKIFPLSQWGGGGCGYATYIGTCMSKQ